MIDQVQTLCISTKKCQYVEHKETRRLSSPPYPKYSYGIKCYENFFELNVKILVIQASVLQFMNTPRILAYFALNYLKNYYKYFIPHHPS